VTLPLYSDCQPLTEELDGESQQIVKHEVHSHTTLYGDELKLVVPKKTGDGWQFNAVALGTRTNKQDVGWAYRWSSPDKVDTQLSPADY